MLDEDGSWLYTDVVFKSSPFKMTATPITTEEKDTHKLPISTDDKTTILLNVEGAVKELINNLSKKQQPKGIDIDEEKLSALPSSMTGVVVHYLVRGLKEDFNIEFAEQPVSLKPRMTNTDKKVAGKKRLLTKDQKNELLAKMQLSYYESDIASGKMSIDDAMTSIKDAFDKKKEYEDMGYMLPAKKTESPFWKE